MMALISTLAIVYGVICLILFIFQRSLLYFPTAETTITVGEEYVFHVNDHEIKAVILHPGREKAVIYFGGNAEQIEDSAADFQKYSTHTFYFVNYRGYGGSSGTPHKTDILKDAQQIFQEIKSRHCEIVLIGRSLGSGVANFLAHHPSVKHVILITPYDSIGQVASEKFTFFPVQLLLTQNFNSLAYLKDIKKSFTIIYSENDQIISGQRTENLINQLKLPPRVINIALANHNNISSFPEFWAGIDAILK